MPAPGSACQADDASAAAVREQCFQQIGPSGRAILDGGNGPGQGAHVARAQRVDRCLDFVIRGCSVQAGVVQANSVKQEWSLGKKGWSSAFRVERRVELRSTPRLRSGQTNRKWLSPLENSQRLVPFRAATWAGPSGASTSDQRRRAERTDYIRSGRDRRKPLAQGWLFRGNHQVNQERNRAR